MKFYIALKKSRLLKIIAAFLIVFIIGCSMTIDSIVQPSSVVGGQVLDVTLNCRLTTNQAQNNKLMVAILVPKAWNARVNTTITFTTTISTGPQGMAPVPAGAPAPNGNGLDWPRYLASKVGNGGNLLSDWEWVAFYSNISYAVGANADIPYKVNIKTKTSTDNMLFKLGYAVANDYDGLSVNDRYGTFFPGCFRVNGQGDLIDFCNPQLSTVEPRTSLDNDIIALTFDAGVATNDLSSATDVYLCATGILDNGTRIDKCVQTPATKMTSLGFNRFSKNIWPRGFFGLTDTQHLVGLEYYFTDQSGNLKVGYGGGQSPFPYTFKCP